MDHFDKIIQRLKKGTTHPVDETVWKKVAANLPPRRRILPFPWWIPLAGLMGITLAGWLGYRYGNRTSTSGMPGNQENVTTVRGQNNQTQRDTIYLRDTVYLNASSSPASASLEPSYYNQQIAALNQRLRLLQDVLKVKDREISSLEQQFADRTSDARQGSEITTESNSGDRPMITLPTDHASLQNEQQKKSEESAARFGALGPLPSLSLFASRNHHLNAPPYMVKAIAPKVHNKWLPEAYRIGGHYGLFAFPQEHELSGAKEYAGGIDLEFIYSSHFSFITGVGWRQFKGTLRDHEHEYLNNYPPSQINDPNLELKELHITKKYIEIPLLLKYAYNFGNEFFLRPYVAGGPLLTRSNNQSFRYEYVGNGSEINELINIPAGKLSLNTLLGQVGVEVNPLYHLSTFADFSFRYQYRLSAGEYGYLHGISFRVGARYEF
ncbi:MAG: outer membrane beta-barrel protein [Saprospiraceae bacterium]